MRHTPWLIFVSAWLGANNYLNRLGLSIKAITMLNAKSGIDLTSTSVYKLERVLHQNVTHFALYLYFTFIRQKALGVFDLSIMCYFLYFFISDFYSYFLLILSRHKYWLSILNSRVVMMHEIKMWMHILIHYQSIVFFPSTLPLSLKLYSSDSIPR